MNSAERGIVEQHIAGLEVFLDLGQPFEFREKVLTNGNGISAMVAALLMKGGGIKLDQTSSDALTDDYLDALDDLPAWCVREALRKWNRGESSQIDGKPHNYEFRPAPPTLRRLAVLERATIAARVHTLQRLLIAAPIPEFSEEHRKDMLARTQALFAGTAKAIAPPKPTMPTVQDPEPLTDEARKAAGLTDTVSHETADAAE